MDPEEDHSMFEQMCRAYEDLRVQALDERVSESDFVSRLGLSAPCFLENPDLFTEVHRMWCDDYNRALMYRVDPFKTTLELLRSHLNPAIPSELRKRKELQRTIMGPLKSPQVVLGASPFDMPRNSSLWKRREKTSLKKLQAAYEASHKEGSSKRGGSLSLVHALLPSPSSQRKLDHTLHKRPTVIIDDSSISKQIVSMRSDPSASSKSATIAATTTSSSSKINTPGFALGDLLSSSRASSRESPRSLARLMGFLGKSK